MSDEPTPAKARLNDELGPDAPAPVRWYCVSRDGLATLCKDEADARATARGSDQAWRTAGPHRAVQLVDAAEVQRLRARVLELEAVHEDASGEVLAERERCADEIAQLCIEVQRYRDQAGRSVNELEFGA
jgi:hypothetical protein